MYISPTARTVAAGGGCGLAQSTRCTKPSHADWDSKPNPAQGADEHLDQGVLRGCSGWWARVVARGCADALP